MTDHRTECVCPWPMHKCATCGHHHRHGDVVADGTPCLRRDYNEACGADCPHPMHVIAELPLDDLAIQAMEE